VLNVHVFATAPAVVRRGYGLTLNLGNYESARLDVSIELPCYVEEIAEADTLAEEFCATRLQEEVRKCRAAGVKVTDKVAGVADSWADDTKAASGKPAAADDDGY
jgi:hypothetical protein